MAPASAQRPLPTAGGVGQLRSQELRLQVNGLS